ncbi:MAG: hypothetical protein HQ551_09865 [Desulfobacteraceae bacterium]|nr:hypothetical protein [Desulfobacteraceae bacterium]
MDSKFPVDSYDLKARYAPALIVSLPVLITLWTCFFPEIQSISKLVGGILSAAILYFISVLVRAYGKNIEPGLWESWGGAPSTQIVSWKNQRIGEDLKGKYHKCVRKDSDLPMLTKEEEEADPEKAKAMIEDAFKRVKGVIRKHDKDGLWSIANAEYGFARNLYGSRLLWLILSIVSLVVSGLFLWVNFSNLVLIGFVLLILNVLACVIFSWRMLPAYTKQVAYRYAEHAWESYCNIAEK